MPPIDEECQPWRSCAFTDKPIVGGRRMQNWPRHRHAVQEMAAEAEQPVPKGVDARSVPAQTLIDCSDKLPVGLIDISCARKNQRRPAAIAEVHHS